MPFNLFSNDNDVYARTISSERSEWRKAIRAIVEEIACIIYGSYLDNKYIVSRLKILKVSLSIRLNQFDTYDGDILESLDKIINLYLRYFYFNDEVKTDIEKEFNLFVHRIRFLLKHDWERVKFESKPFWSILKKTNISNKIINRDFGSYPDINHGLNEDKRSEFSYSIPKILIFIFIVMLIFSFTLKLQSCISESTHIITQKEQFKIKNLK